MQATNLEAFINDKKVAQVPSLSGSNLSFTFRVRTLYPVYVSAAKGLIYKQIGVLRTTNYLFNFNGDNYKFVSSSPIIGSGGKWKVWVYMTLTINLLTKTTSQFESGGN
jgi:hypothetical protein